MGCRTQAKQAFKAIASQVKPKVVESARDMVIALDAVALPTLTGQMKTEIAVQALMAAAKREGNELRTSIATAVVTGIVTALRQGAGVDELGTDDAATESLPA